MDCDFQSSYYNLFFAIVIVVLNVCCFQYYDLKSVELLSSVCVSKYVYIYLNNQTNYVFRRCFAVGKRGVSGRTESPQAGGQDTGE